MKTNNYLQILTFITVSCFLTACNYRSVEQIPIRFEDNSSSLTDYLKTINSFNRKDNFFVLNYIGDYDDKVKWLQDYFDRPIGRLLMT